MITATAEYRNDEPLPIGICWLLIVGLAVLSWTGIWFLAAWVLF